MPECAHPAHTQTVGAATQDPIRGEDCSKEFTLDVDGKPFYVSGPHDSEEKSRRIVEQLARRCGAGKFDYLGLYSKN
jgi:hypothetical protein